MGNGIGSFIDEFSVSDGDETAETRCFQSAPLSVRLDDDSLRTVFRFVDSVEQCRTKFEFTPDGQFCPPCGKAVGYDGNGTDRLQGADRVSSAIAEPMIGKAAGIDGNAAGFLSGFSQSRRVRRRVDAPCENSGAGSGVNGDQINGLFPCDGAICVFIRAGDVCAISEPGSGQRILPLLSPERNRSDK